MEFYEGDLHCEEKSKNKDTKYLLEEMHKIKLVETSSINEQKADTVKMTKSAGIGKNLQIHWKIMKLTRFCVYAVKHQTLSKKQYKVQNGKKQ